MANSNASTVDVVELKEGTSQEGVVSGHERPEFATVNAIVKGMLKVLITLTSMT